MKTQISPVVGVIILVVVLAIAAWFVFTKANRDVVSVPPSTVAKTNSKNEKVEDTQPGAMQGGQPVDMPGMGGPGGK